MPFFNDKEEPDDRYILPLENYKTMSIGLYAELLRVDL